MQNFHNITINKNSKYKINDVKQLIRLLKILFPYLSFDQLFKLYYVK